MYADVLFMENVILNYVILSLTARWGKFSYKWYKLLSASAVGSLYAVVMYLPSMSFMRGFTPKILLSMLIIVVAFTPSRLIDFFRQMTVFYMITFAFGGCSIALYYLAGNNQAVVDGVYYSIVGAFFAAIVVKASLNYINTKIHKDRLSLILKIVVDGKSNEMTALVDTGNSLYEPLSRWPVVVVEFKRVEKLLPESIKELYLKGLEKDLTSLTLALADTDWMSRVRIVPFSSLGRENGVLLGFKPDSIFIKGPEEKEIKNVVVAIYNNTLSKNQEYGALLHPDIL
ncbi:sigma-E processing peptidase SpoIIGA [Caldanaerobius polysaccharolyticus]|uniref:sigma-E processing peptidase SpoIIGA n=1 Tax=Caldanaerobius polysaccharolyticus TaxID=44256 RepID=UPI00047D77E2|nr:sigma-E processing peptidase SpoIIGA [Caldanaerobius polysaccharolyticus]